MSAYDDYEARHLSDMGGGRPRVNRGRTVAPRRSTPEEDFGPVQSEASHRDEISPYFGPTAIFFPLSPTAPGAPKQWRDPHACIQCGAAVLLPMVHVQFHADLAVSR